MCVSQCCFRFFHAGLAAWSSCGILPTRQTALLAEASGGQCGRCCFEPVHVGPAPHKRSPRLCKVTLSQVGFFSPLVLAVSDRSGSREDFAVACRVAHLVSQDQQTITCFRAEARSAGCHSHHFQCALLHTGGVALFKLAVTLVSKGAPAGCSAWVLDAQQWTCTVCTKLTLVTSRIEPMTPVDFHWEFVQAEAHPQLW